MTSWGAHHAMDASLARWRRDKDQAFKVPGQSPLTDAQLELIVEYVRAVQRANGLF